MSDCVVGRVEGNNHCSGRSYSVSSNIFMKQLFLCDLRKHMLIADLQLNITNRNASI